MIAAVLAAALSATPVYREIGDWIIACDNIRTCTLKAVGDAINASPIGDADRLGVTITRDAGASGKLSILLTFQDKIDPAKLQLDGRPLTFAWKDTQDGPALEGATALAFIKAIRDGKMLKDGGTAASLKGLAAVLLAADDAQGRIGNATALARPGPAPASAVPPPPALPTVMAASAPPPLKDPAALAAAVRRAKAADLQAHDCEPASVRAGEDSAEPLTATEALVFVSCIFGAYQGSALVYRTPRDAPAKAQLMVLPDLKIGEDSISGAPGEYGTAEYDSKRGVLASHAKGRGIGDCGVSADWLFDGKAFQLSDYSLQDRCGGADPDWPTLYRSRTVKAR